MGGRCEGSCGGGVGERWALGEGAGGGGRLVGFPFLDLVKDGDVAVMLPGESSLAQMLCEVWEDVASAFFSFGRSEFRVIVK